MGRTALAPIALAALLGLILAGCTGSKPAATPAPPATPSLAATPAPGTAPPAPAGVQRGYNAPASALAAPGPHQRRALADVDAILAMFIPPPGSRRLPGPPGGTWWEAPGTPGGWMGPYDSVTDTSWWRVPGQAKAIATWEQAHPPRGSVASRPDSLGPTEVTAEASPPPGRQLAAPPGNLAPSPGAPPANVYSGWSEAFWLPPARGVLPGRYLIVEPITNNLGQLYVRVESQVMWAADRAASERVPAATRSVTIIALLGAAPPGRAGGPVTVTGQGEVARIVALLNGLPVYSGPACNLVPTDGIRLVFRDASGRLLGAVVAPVSSCTVQLSLAGQPTQPGLASSPALIPDLLRIAGIHWLLH